MRLALVGVGDAGARIVNQILALEKASGRNLCNGNSLLVNSSKPVFDTNEHVPEERRLTIGDAYWEVDRRAIDGDPDLAADVAREERNELIRAFDLIEFHQIDGVLVVAGLAGGTGGGAGAVVIEQLKTICDEPVYGVGVLPSESEGQRPALTASRTLQSFVAKADNVIVFDNDTWLRDARPAVGASDAPRETPDHNARDRSDDGGASDGPEPDETDDEGTSEEPDGDVQRELTGEEPDGDVQAKYTRANVALAERLVTLFAAGEFGGASAAENLLDPSDIMRTLDTGGLSSIGYASVDVAPNSGIDAWLRALRTRLPWFSDPESGDEDDDTDAARTYGLVRQAAHSRFTVPCEVSSADRALILLSGPSRTLSRKGFENGRYWLEREADIVDVMAGDEPHERSSTLTAVVLFSNVTDVPRIDAMQETALARQRSESTDEWRFGTVDPR